MDNLISNYWFEEKSIYNLGRNKSTILNSWNFSTKLQFSGDLMLYGSFRGEINRSLETNKCLHSLLHRLCVNKKDLENRNVTLKYS